MLDETDIAVLKRYGQGPYAEQLKQLETDIEECVKKVSSLKFSLCFLYSEKSNHLYFSGFEFISAGYREISIFIEFYF